MPLMTWDATLDIGVPAMNEDHREILGLMNAIFDAHKRGETGAPIEALVAKLGEVCVQHFTDEEAFMQKTGFPGLAGHKILHQKLLAKYGELAAAIRADGGRANDEFFSFLKFWLSAHIKGIDVKYAAHAGMKRAG